MVTPSVGAVVLVPFPFSDLSQSKMRPAVVVANSGRDDWILCQVTSSPYGDPRAIPLFEAGFRRGTLQRESYARPGKLFTAHRGLMIRQVGMLEPEAMRTIIDAIVGLLRSGLNP